MMLKYPCLVLDHDDTTVNSTATVHYPCFKEYMEKYFPDVHLTLEEYFLYNFDPGVVELFTNICGMTWEQMLPKKWLLLFFRMIFFKSSYSWLQFSIFQSYLR